MFLLKKHEDMFMSRAGEERVFSYVCGRTGQSASGLLA